MPDVLTNKQSPDYPKLSRYNNFYTYLHEIDNKTFYGKTAWLNPNTQYALHTVAQGEDLPKIALMYYNDSMKYWVIADFNRICNPFEILKVGQQLKIPALGSIEFEQTY
jgi:hypothetical protein